MYNKAIHVALYHAVLGAILLLPSTFNCPGTDISEAAAHQPG